MTSDQPASQEPATDETLAAESVSNTSPTDEQPSADEPSATEEQPSTDGPPSADGPPSTDGQPSADGPSTETDFIEALKEVIDPELMINIVDLGLIYSIAQDEENPRLVKVDMTLTSPACPAGPQLVQQSKMALERLHDIDEAAITMVMSPPWSPERMTDDARDQLGIF